MVFGSFDCDHTHVMFLVGPLANAHAHVFFLKISLYLDRKFSNIKNALLGML